MDTGKYHGRCPNCNKEVSRTGIGLVKCPRCGTQVYCKHPEQPKKK